MPTWVVADAEVLMAPGSSDVLGVAFEYRLSLDAEAANTFPEGLVVLPALLTALIEADMVTLVCAVWLLRGHLVWEYGDKFRAGFFADLDRR